MDGTPLEAMGWKGGLVWVFKERVPRTHGDRGSFQEVNEALRGKLLDCLKEVQGGSRGLRFDSVAHNNKKW